MLQKAPGQDVRTTATITNVGNVSANIRIMSVHQNKTGPIAGWGVTDSGPLISNPGDIWYLDVTALIAGDWPISIYDTWVFIYDATNQSIVYAQAGLTNSFQVTSKISFTIENLNIF